MPVDYSGESRPGYFAGENSPPDQLDLETGWVDDHRATLEPGHRFFDLFEWAWREQDAWSIEQHRRFWQATIDLWPARGRSPVVGMLSHAMRAAMQRDMTTSEAAGLLGYDVDDLRRQGVLRAAAAEPAAAVTAYVLPRVYSGAQPAPNADAYPNLEAPATNDPRVAEIAGKLLARG